jgi:hypothetical protein
MSNNPKFILGFKIGMLMLKAMRGDPEGAMMEVIDDYDKSEKKDELMNKLANFLMKRYSAEEIEIGVNDEGLELLLIGVDDPMVQIYDDISGLVGDAGKIIPAGDFLDKLTDVITVSYKEDTRTCGVEIDINNENVKARLKEVLI